MRQKVMLSLRGVQTYLGQEPDVIELVTEGYLEQLPNGWSLSYEESDLTGLAGVHTSFLLEDGCVTLTRTGKLNSQMIFREGVSHDSLYSMEFGTLMITVCARQIRWHLTQQGGTVDLKYSIEVEQSAAGEVDYHLEVSAKET